MDVVADRLGMDPVEFRRINLIRDGQQTATGQTIEDGVDRLEVLDSALRSSDWTARRAEFDQQNAVDPLIKRGLGLAVFHHGAGFTGNGELMLQSVVHVAGTQEGGVEVRTASVEMGQGMTTIFTQLAADRLGLDADSVTIAQPDTHRVPNSGPSVASRTSMVVGFLVEQACDDLRRQLGLADDVRGSAVTGAIKAWYSDPSSEELIGESTYVQPHNIDWDEDTYLGDAYGAYAWAAYVAEVEVDLRTYGTRVTNFVAVQEIGRVLNETLARGQIQGGVAQAISWALLEDFRWQDGAMQNCQLTNYIIPTSDDLPPIQVEFLETPYPFGAQGSKGIGELPMDGPGPAIANALAHALGIPATAIPITPERLMGELDSVAAREAS
jgi:CO/xanthine dehydrogenase Mo-binding subunit